MARSSSVQRLSSSKQPSDKSTHTDGAGEGAGVVGAGVGSGEGMHSLRARSGSSAHVPPAHVHVSDQRPRANFASR